MKRDDPKLTAYALGELDGAERANVEKQVSESDELRIEIKAISQTGELLSKELALEPCPMRTGDERRDIEQAMDGRTSTKASGLGVRRMRGLRVWIPTAVAASVLLGVTAVYWRSANAARRQSRQDAAISYISRVATPSTVPGTSGVDQIPPGVRLSDAQRTRDYWEGVSNGSISVQQFAAPSTGDSETDARALAPLPSPATPLATQTSDLRSRIAALGLRLQPHTPSPHRNDGPATFAGAGGSSRQLQLFQRSESVAALGEALVLSEQDYPPIDVLDSWSQGPLDASPLTAGHPGLGAEAYDHVIENAFLRVLDNPLSTFSIDVDTASYANVRRMLTQGVWPPAGAVRIEEMVNYFDYDYPPPTGADPFSVNVEIAECPWNPEHRLARVGLKGMEFTPEQRPPANLVFLVDVSGSMQPENKLPLLKEAMKLLVSELNDDDSVAIVVYAGASGVVLEPIWASNRKVITDALDRLQAGGSTNGGAGISLAYDLAIKGFVEGGVNRVILATDGDLNVGLTSQSDLVSLVEDRAKAGVFLSVLGFGMGNYKDSTLEKLADKGNGNYAYIDTEREARKVLVEEVGGTLVTIAKDVKIQIEFNPAMVAAYRLIGYENRLLAAQDFNDDAKDAGEIGAGHTVTAFYELIPAGGELPADLPTVDPLKYQAAPGVSLESAPIGDVVLTDSSAPIPVPRALTPLAYSHEMMTVKLRYKEPDGDVSKLIEVPVRDTGSTLAQASDDFVFAASVASFGMLLRGGAPANPVDAAHTPAGASPASATRPLPDITLAEVHELAASTLGRDPSGYRAEFVGLLQRAEELRGR